MSRQHSPEREVDGDATARSRSPQRCCDQGSTAMSLPIDDSSDSNSLVFCSGSSDTDGEGDLRSDSDSESESSETVSIQGDIPKMPVSAARIMAGSEKYYELLSTAPEGPKTIKEFAQMTRRLIKDFASDERVSGGQRRMNRLGAVVCKGLVIHHDFAGRQGYEMAFKQIQLEMARYGMPPNWLIFWRTSEPCKLSRKCIEQGNLAPEHSFQSIEKVFLSEVECNMLQEKMDTRGETEEEKRSWSVQVEDWIIQQTPRIFAKTSCTQNCTLHDGSCAVRWVDSRSESEKAITVACGGPHCTPHCPGGRREGRLHKAYQPFRMFIGDHAEGNYDISLIEQSSRFPPEMYAHPMRVKHKVVYAIFGSEDLGVPCYRTRFMGGGLNYASLVWVGPNVEDCTADFLEFVQAKAMVSSEVFARKDAPNMIEHTKKLYARRTANVALHEPGVDVKDLLPLHAQGNYDASCAKYMRGEKNGMIDGCAADVSQSESRMRMGPFLPTLQKSSIMVALPNKAETLAGLNPQGHLFTCGELSFSQGWPTLEESPHPLRQALNYDLSAHGLAHQTRLLGDGMNLWCVEAWILYVLTHTLRREAVERFDPACDMRLLRVDQVPDEEMQEQFEYDL